MRKTPRSPTYAIIAPATTKQLLALVEKALESPDSDDEPDRTWEIVGGTKQYAALWDYDPAGDNAYVLAPMVSRAVRGTVFIAQLNKYTYGSYAYERGQAGDKVLETPEKLATRLGVPFPPRADISSERAWSVCVVEGAVPEIVNSVLDLTPEDRAVVKVQPHPLGTIIFASDESPVLGVGGMVKGDALEHAMTYAIERSHGDVLQIWIYRDGDVISFFTTDESLGLGPPRADRTWDIKGAREIDGILAVLQIPPALLGQ